ncbi:type II toxin-antitoxin system VapC family toxin [Halomonas cupida]|uniref:Ribonuclease VapC n=1 Tax=Halomonas cupida TaxID=44933 RepID=A0A1M7CKN7_9GAMM|nr:type II toxin-antitoxin system VapC family toxin [Halomonas cupida]GEN26155.1 ribonuclease VapC [Halomonas cupida]SHL67772.1 hypothetical protein SAMN05660971_01132 [Halomonas cupida]
MIVLDTNVVSELMKAEPEASVVKWLDAQDAWSVMVSAITVAEVFYGIERLPDGKRKSDLSAVAVAMFGEDFAGRILPFDGEAAICYAELVATRERSGRGVSVADAQIAAICRQYASGLATRNIKDFECLGIELINPWDV